MAALSIALKSWRSSCKLHKYTVCYGVRLLQSSVNFSSTSMCHCSPSKPGSEELTPLVHHIIKDAVIGQQLKTHTCNCLRVQDVGANVQLRGFVSFIRQKFILIRDSYGITQVLIPEQSDLTTGILKDLTYESYIEVKGIVHKRPDGQDNERFDTGAVEVVAAEINMLSKAPSVLPFLIRQRLKPTELLGLKHRQLQLRFPHLHRNLRLRSQVKKRMSDYLEDGQGFIDVTTPTLSSDTTGGAHLFRVLIKEFETTTTTTAPPTPTSVSAPPPRASRLSYYSLAQSPQSYKQLLMMGGLDKYYQFAVCYRDERVAPDRQLEFMQLDLEMSDVTVHEVRQLVEELLVYSWPSECYRHLTGPPPLTPFPSITYTEAINKYGSDKPDTRFGWQISDVSTVVSSANFTGTVLQGLLLEGSTTAHAFVVPGGQQRLTKKVQASWQALAAREYNTPGVSFLTRLPDNGLKGPLAKYFTEEGSVALVHCVGGASVGDTIVMAVGPTNRTLSLLGRLRLLGADLLESCGDHVRDQSTLPFLWVVDFPLFELAEDGATLQSVHHPFTRPHPDDMHLLDTHPLQVRSQHYDLVSCGCEVGGGSVRIHEAELQARVLEILNHPTEDLSYFIDALAYGAPPHAGIALGFDRLISLLCRAASIREVIAFPKNGQGRCPMMGIPAPVTEEIRRTYF